MKLFVKILGGIGIFIFATLIGLFIYGSKIQAQEKNLSQALVQIEKFNKLKLSCGYSFDIYTPLTSQKNWDNLFNHVTQEKYDSIYSKIKETSNFVEKSHNELSEEVKINRCIELLQSLQSLPIYKKSILLDAVKKEITIFEDKKIEILSLIERKKKEEAEALEIKKKAEAEAYAKSPKGIAEAKEEAIKVKEEERLEKIRLQNVAIEDKKREKEYLREVAQSALTPKKWRKLSSEGV